MFVVEESYSAQAFAEIVRLEGDGIELKTGVSAAKLQEAMVAFSNGDGGVIFIGVADDRTVVSRSLDQGTDDKIHEAALTARDLGRYEVREIRVQGSPVVAVQVWRREEGFAQTSDGRTLVRRGGRNVALFGADLWSHLSTRVLRRFERTPSNLRMDEAEPVALQALCDAFGWSLDDPGLGERLAERGFAAEGRLSIAGALLVTRPGSALNLTKAVVEVRRFADEGPDYNRRVEFDGPLPVQIRDATRFVLDELGTDLVVTGLYRQEIPRLPEVVVREAIANAVAHRTYEVNRTPVLIELRPAVVIVRSPGPLPPPVTVATMRVAQAARNPDVIAALRRFHLAEDAGRGVDVMQDEMAAALLSAPEFVDDGISVTVRLPLDGPITVRERAWVNQLHQQGDLTVWQRLLLVNAARGTRLTNAAARRVVNSDDRERVRRDLQHLRDLGLLVQHGSHGGAAYVLADDLGPAAVYRRTPEELEDMVVAEATRRALTNAVVRELTGLDRPRSTALLQRLVARGRLRQRGTRRQTTYHLPNE